MKKEVRWFTGSGIGLALLALGGCGHKAAARAAAPAALEVRTAAVEARTVNDVLQASGSFIAQEQSNVAPRVPGLIAATPAHVGDFVHKGQPLARLDDRDAELRLQQAQAQLEQAKARLGWNGKGSFNPQKVPQVISAGAAERSAAAQARLAASQLKRYTGLVGTGDISKTTWDQAQTQAATAAAQAEAAEQQYEAALNAAQQEYQGVLDAEAQLGLARKALNDTIVPAPFSGYVSQRQVSVGEHVGAAAVVVTLVKLTPIKLDLELPESETPRLRTGLPVEARVAGFGERRFAGAITAISPSVDPKSRTLLVEAHFPNLDRSLHPGMFATADILLPRQTRALFVPASAVIDDASTDSHEVYILDGKRARLKVVQTGASRGSELRILRGLEPGDQVITDPSPRLFDGAPVQVNGLPAPASTSPS